MAMLARSGLQLAFQQTLQMGQSLGMIKNGFERSGFAQKHSRSASLQGTKGHESRLWLQVRDVIRKQSLAL
jgi:hypothetical protein